MRITPILLRVSLTGVIAALFTVVFFTFVYQWLLHDQNSLALHKANGDIELFGLYLGHYDKLGNVLLQDKWPQILVTIAVYIIAGSFGLMFNKSRRSPFFLSFLEIVLYCSIVLAAYIFSGTVLSSFGIGCYTCECFCYHCLHFSMFLIPGLVTIGLIIYLIKTKSKFFHACRLPFQRSAH